MKVRDKITIIILAITILFVAFSILAFEKFFKNYLEDQEKVQANSISRSIFNYLNERKNKYQGTVNDWGHWDDTYDFLNKENPNYIKNNLSEDTFSNLDLNFVILVGKNNVFAYKQFYDIDNNKFTQFPSGLIENIEDLIKISTYKNTSDILKLGDQLYFVATSEITDSNNKKQANGKMLIGRLIDKSIITGLEEMTDSQITFSEINNISHNVTREQLTIKDGSILRHELKLNEKKDALLIELFLPNTEDSFVVVKLTKNRDFFIKGMNQNKQFLLIYSIIMFLFTFIVFTLLGRYISRPFDELINEVKALDLANNEIRKLEIFGKDEFSFLRNAINNMLSRIEAEQNKVRENEDRLYATLISVGDGVIAVDKKSKVEFINPIAQQLTGWSYNEAYGESLETVFNIVNEYSREQAESQVQKVFETEEIVELASHNVLIAKDGSKRAIEDTVAPIRDKFGNIIGVVIVFRDLSDKKEKQRRIEYLSYHDQLTGLYNRRFFDEELKRLDVIRNFPLTLLMADVNGLKIINDAFGHESGDQLLQKVADVLTTECRADDIIGIIGGDEFYVLLPKTDSASAGELIKRIKGKIEQEKIMDINISISFGWDTKNTETQSTREVLKNAEDMMYQKKIFENSSKRSEVIKSILNTLHIKSSREDAHSKRVSFICEAIGKAYNLNDDEVKELRIAGELHDIGKIAVDEVILNKKGNLSEAEWDQMHRHPEIGYRLLGTSSEYYSIAEYVFMHHEKWDGTGYPKALKGESIQWKARVIGIADAYDAMTSERPYRKSFSEKEAVSEIKKHSGTQFDPEIARVFVEKVLGLAW